MTSHNTQDFNIFIIHGDSQQVRCTAVVLSNSLLRPSEVSVCQEVRVEVSGTWPTVAFAALSHLTHLSDSRSCRSVFLAELQQMSPRQLHVKRSRRLQFSLPAVLKPDPWHCNACPLTKSAFQLGPQAKQATGQRRSITDTMCKHSENVTGYEKVSLDDCAASFSSLGSFVHDLQDSVKIHDFDSSFSSRNTK